MAFHMPHLGATLPWFPFHDSIFHVDRSGFRILLKSAVFALFPAEELVSFHAPADRSLPIALRTLYPTCKRFEGEVLALAPFRCKNDLSNPNLAQRALSKSCRRNWLRYLLLGLRPFFRDGLWEHAFQPELPDLRKG